MRATGNKQSKLSHCISTTERFLRRARDFYVDCMINFSGRCSSASAVSCAVSHLSHVPYKDFGGGHDHNSKPYQGENLEQVYKSLCKRYNMKFDGSVRSKQRKGGYGARIDRSYSVAVGKIGTINEDEPCEFQVDFADIFFQRSKSSHMLLQ